jgi:bifunctional DNA-binding transcriptional regulator/antitoxin component of YhaV-PrlF toxin-antitoxin module
MDRVLGTSKVQPNNRITVLKKVQKKLGLKIGDLVVYIEDDKGNVVLRKVQLSLVVLKDGK